ncbi:hypothetical protein [uncultured Marivita sp.]|uniref:hypothetical protein n=1 Tax=uncultured Marivita sp. TaxID=888080 RepID=UPI002616F1D7|nr:hypothetical protein [uncultured Marivita sp.]
MSSSNQNLVDLHRCLLETNGAYDALYQRVQDTELGDAISVILSRREENIQELENFLASEGEEIASPEAPQPTDVSTPGEVVANENKILDAYDRAIRPISGEHEKFGFLVDQYDWLKEVVDRLEATIVELPGTYEQ